MAMEMFGKFLNNLKVKIKKAVEEGDLFRANEIDSNMMLGNVIFIMEAACILCLLLNEIGIFSADSAAMRITMLLVIVIDTPIILLNYNNHGDKPWLRKLLCGGLIAVCGLLTSTLGHNVTFAMLIPVIASLRYCDEKLTRNIAIISVLVMALATLGNAFFGIVNLNVYQVSESTTVVITNKIRNSLDLSDINNWQYFKDLFINDLLPKYMAFAVISFICIKISDKGRELTVMQDNITQKTQRLETELNLATEIQASMLPCIFPAFPDHSELDLFAINYPAKEVGGDFYDYFIIDPEHIAIVMADVSGKGVGAALFMTISKIVLKNQLMSTVDPALAFENTNKQLCENNDAQLFVTAWAGIFNTTTKVITFANAGHNPPVITRKGQKPEFLTSKIGLVLAGLENTKYVNNTVKLEEGDEILLYTDGVTEANDPDENLYGEERLLELVEEKRNLSSLDKVNSIMLKLQEYMNGIDQFDDITIMSMRIKEK